MDRKMTGATDAERPDGEELVEHPEREAGFGRPRRGQRQAGLSDEPGPGRAEDAGGAPEILDRSATRGSEFGVPARKAEGSVSGWTPADEKYFRAEQPADTAVAPKGELDFSPEATGHALRSALLNTTTLLAIGALVSLFLLFVISQTLLAIGSLRTITAGVPLAGWIAEALIYLLFALVVAFFARIVWLFWSLKRSSRYEIPTAQALRERADLRQKASRARTEMTAYVRDYMALGRTRALFTAEEAERLRKSAKFLLEREMVSDDEWFDHLENGFVGVLDDCANRRIGRARNFVAVKTAATPIGMIDTIIVAVHSTWLIGDIARIYNLRAGTMGTAVIAGQAFANIYLASNLGAVGESLFGGGETETAAGAQAAEVAGSSADVGQAAGDQASEATAGWLSKVPFANNTLEELGLNPEDFAETAGNAAGSLARFAGPKIAEGLANGLLVARLGKSAAKLVRPIR
jgi:uncharacterized membrane protein YcjF (UPF0283 family)